MKEASRELVKLAKRAARAHAAALAANAAWVAAFRAEYGHDDISDALVEAIDYSIGDTNVITREFIAAHSKAGNS